MVIKFDTIEKYPFLLKKLGFIESKIDKWVPLAWRGGKESRILYIGTLHRYSEFYSKKT